jgi:Fe2+ or Zn2+ uptake regulation protein
MNLDYRCLCGYEQVITSDDLEGHMFICPQCGNVHEVDEAHDLELIEVIAETA